MTLKQFFGVLITVFFVFSQQVLADETSESITQFVEQFAPSLEHANRFGALPVQSTNGRIIPLNTFSSEIVRKLTKKTKVGQLSSDQFLLSLLALPDMWMHVPLISCSNDDITDYFGFQNKKIAYIQFFKEDGSYHLQEKLNEAYRKAPADRSKFDRDIIQIDEKVNILHQLLEYQLVHIFPKLDDPDKKWYAPGDDLSLFNGQDSLFVSHYFFWYLSDVQQSMQSGDWSKPNQALDMILTYQAKMNNIPDFDHKKIDLEVKYNKLQIFSWCKVGYLSLGGLLLLFSFVSFIGKKTWIRWVSVFIQTGICFIFLFQLFGMGIRWKISGYAPWSNSYETMVLLALVMVLAGLLFSKRSRITFALATLFAGIILFVSGLNWLDPQISPLVPVLKSPWLMFHVAILMAAYGFFGIGFLIGGVNLSMITFFRKDKQNRYNLLIHELSMINEISLIIGLFLMTIGTFMGAVWANESWGRYWGWDPKETWALITMIVYAMVVHLHLLKNTNRLWLFNLCSVLAFISVLMTYFGVNYFLSGMHSYGS